MNYLYIIGTIVFAVYSQAIIKWRIGNLGFELPEGLFHKAIAIIKLLYLDPYVFSGLSASFISFMCWTAAMSKFELTQVYPFMSLISASIFIIGIWCFGETFTIGKVVGFILIILGIIATVKL
jgi:undecaprenyl phosphate-alpha-L-ara4N flippase subunit ArnF